jgi:hypothetical protein
LRAGARKVAAEALGEILLVDRRSVRLRDKKRPKAKA